MIPPFNSLSMFAGAAIAWIVVRYDPKVDEKYIIPVSSGLIAGESLVGVTVRLIEEAPSLVSRMLAFFR